MIKCKNREFYLLEPLKFPGLIRSFFGFVRRNFEQLEVPRKNTANQVTGRFGLSVPLEGRVCEFPGPIPSYIVGHE